MPTFYTAIGTTVKAITIAFFMLCSNIIQAQKAKVVQGFLFDSTDKSPVELCNISIYKWGDTTKLLQLLSNKKGAFSFKAGNDSLLVKFEHGIYVTKLLPLLLLQNDLDTIWLIPAIKELQEVTVKAATPAIVVRHDTTEYNIDSFEVQDNDVVADLLRRLPGLEMDGNGGFIFQGKPITKITIDGEEFFGGNQTFSLNKLPAGFVSRIQVMDSKTLEDVFNGIGANGDEKTLNIKLKSGIKSFSDASITAGTRNQLRGQISGSIIKDKQSVSVMGNSNYSNKLGKPSPANGPQSSSNSISVNLGNKWGRSSIQGSYTFGNNSNAFDYYSERRQFITVDSSFFRTNSNSNNNISQSHRANINGNIWVDSFTTLNVGLVYGRSENDNQSWQRSQTAENGVLRNKGSRNSKYHSQNENLNANIMFGKRFKNSGRSFSIYYLTGLNHNVSDGNNNTEDLFYKTGFADSLLSLNQHIQTNNSNQQHSIRFSYTEPIGKKIRLLLTGASSWTETKADRFIYNRDTLQSKESLDSSFSNRLQTTDHTQLANASLNYSSKRLYVTTGFGITANQSLRQIENKGDIKQRQLNYTPSANANLQLGTGKSLRLSFTGNSMYPTIEQLQPIPDNTNPLFIRVGNPALKASFTQNYSLGYSMAKQRQSLYATVSYAPVSHSIVNATYYNSLLQQVSQYVNVSGIYRLQTNFSFSKQTRQEMRVFMWNTGIGGNFGRNVFFQNGKQFYTRNYTVQTNAGFAKRLSQAEYAPGISSNISFSYSRTLTPLNSSGINSHYFTVTPNVDVTYSLFKIINFSTGYRLSYSDVSYSANRNNTTQPLQHIVSETLFLPFSKWSRLESTLLYSHDNQVAFGVNPDIFTWNASTSISFAKHHAAYIKLSAFDLLRSARNTRRTVGENFIEDSQTANLQNYFTIELRYNFSHIKKQASPLVKKPKTG